MPRGRPKRLEAQEGETLTEENEKVVSKPEDQADEEDDSLDEAVHHLDMAIKGSDEVKKSIDNCKIFFNMGADRENFATRTLPIKKKIDDIAKSVAIAINILTK